MSEGEAAAPLDDDFYDAQADQDDQDHVNNQQQHESLVMSSSNTDAVLSCPCCFQTVCRDCQQHDRYPNQYRAMFVLNILVDDSQVWTHGGESSGGGLVKVSASSMSTQQLAPLFYSVQCDNCHTQVAVLDPVEEVYHFTGCVAASG